MNSDNRINRKKPTLETAKNTINIYYDELKPYNELDGFFTVQDLSNNINTDTKSLFDVSLSMGSDKVAGKGIGNMTISNDFRNGNSTRTNTREHRETIESRQFFDYKFNYLDKNYQDPNHIVLPFPRGGDTTRRETKNEQIDETDQDKLKRIHIKY
jgi:hypothetical protein